MAEVIFGWDGQVANWVQHHLKQAVPFQSFRAIGILHEDEIVAGVVYDRFSGHDLMMSIASTKPTWATRSTLRTLFKYPFDQLGCERVTALVARKNKCARRMLERLGFVLEGVARKGYDGRQDAMIYGMLKTECKWRA